VTEFEKVYLEKWGPVTYWCWKHGVPLWFLIFPATTIIGAIIITVMVVAKEAIR